MEDYSDGEAPALPELHTPPGVGRFAALRGVQRSGGDEPDKTGEAEAVEVQAEEDTLPANLEERLNTASPQKEEEALPPGDPSDLDAFFAEAKPSEEDPFTRLAAEATGEASDDDAPGEEGSPGKISAEETLEEEHWAKYPAAERELWERVRPRLLRREAQAARGLRLPVTAVNRLMRLHPKMQMKSAEAQDAINLSTVLLLKALCKAAARGKLPGQRISFEDLKDACSTFKELQFLHPLSGTLDPTATVLRSGGEQPVNEAAESSKRIAKGPVETPGQSKLSAAAFASNAQAPADQDAAEDEKADDASTRKRKAPDEKNQKPAKAKAQRKEKKVAVAAGERPVATVQSFFRRADAPA